MYCKNDIHSNIQQLAPNTKRKHFREASHIDFFHEKRHMNTKIQHFYKCIYILSICMLIIRSWLCPKCTFTLLYTTLNLKDCKVNNATGASATSKKLRDVSKGGGGGVEGLQKNIHMTFLVDKIDL